MTDEYWFWLTFPGGVVIGLIALSPFIIGYGLWYWYKSYKEKQLKAQKYAKYLELLRNIRGEGKNETSK